MARKLPPPNGVVLYEGPSMIDGAPIVCIATGINTDSTNGKTGALIQTWIMRADVSPLVAVRTGDDASVCGDCPERGRIVDGKNVDRSCYVEIFQAPRNVWSTWKNRRYPSAWDASTFSGRAVRLGSYGDPAAVPYHVWREVLQQAAKHTGYTHQWSRFPELAAWCMASCDSESDRVRAKFLGFRTFRVMPQGAPLMDSREVRCPASKEAGAKTTCERCVACGGTSARAKVDMAIEVHGAASKVAAWSRVHAA
jgi:hypothetical protein